MKRKIYLLLRLLQNSVAILVLWLVVMLLEKRIIGFKELVAKVKWTLLKMYD